MSFEKEFWNKRILSWERSKYKSISKKIDVNYSVKRRLHLATHLLQQVSARRDLLELGCGSGRLWERDPLIESGKL